MVRDGEDPALPGTVEVACEDANNYSRILTLLGMEEEGDPVVEVALLKTAAAMTQATPGSRQECADLRNVIQAACAGGLPAMARAWEKYFPDHPISIVGIPGDGGPEEFARQRPFRDVVTQWLRDEFGGVEADNVGKSEFLRYVRLAERAHGVGSCGEDGA